MRIISRTGLAGRSQDTPWQLRESGKLQLAGVYSSWCAKSQDNKQERHVCVCVRKILRIRLVCQHFYLHPPPKTLSAPLNLSQQQEHIYAMAAVFSNRFYWPSRAVLSTKMLFSLLFLCFSTDITCIQRCLIFLGRELTGGLSWVLTSWSMTHMVHILSVQHTTPNHKSQVDTCPTPVAVGLEVPMYMLKINSGRTKPQLVFCQTTIVNIPPTIQKALSAECTFMLPTFERTCCHLDNCLILQS